MARKKLEVADFFCGAGGFSEGFRQNGFNLVFALDYWQPAINTHHLNHPNCRTTKMNILDLDTPDKIDKWVPDVDVIIGSPPCVAFSDSNKAGKADKSLGIRLVEAYLRIIAWKKSKESSRLKYWVLENVPKTGDYIKKEYTWKELGLPGDGPDLKIQVRNILNSADYGAPQLRKRFICGDFPFPQPLCKSSDDWVPLEIILKSLTNPFKKKENIKIVDPNYSFSIDSKELTDHFYDTRVAEFEWRKAKRLKRDHGYMGKMSFPENIERPSRTVMATRSASTREAMILDALDSDDKHIGYRLPTIREIASLMSFPITYQFDAGSESSKYRLVGNAVCPKLSSAIAKAILDSEGIEPPEEFIHLPEKPCFNLNGTKIEIKRQKDKSPSAKFGVHIPYLKIKGFRVELNNKESDFENGYIKWSCVLHQGTGKNALKCKSTECRIDKIADDIIGFEYFKKDVYHIFEGIDMTHEDFQKSYICSCATEHITPQRALKMMKEVVDRHFPEDDIMIENSNGNICINRNKVPVRIVAGLYACDYLVKTLKNTNC